MTHPDLIAIKERLHELKAQRRGLDLQEDEALAVIQYANERRPVLDELIGACERQIDDMRPKSAMSASDQAWTLKRLREWCNTL